jgi:hypothetical protein
MFYLYSWDLMGVEGADFVPLEHEDGIATNQTDLITGRVPLLKCVQSSRTDRLDGIATNQNTMFAQSPEKVILVCDGRSSQKTI